MLIEIEKRKWLLILLLVLLLPYHLGCTEQNRISSLFGGNNAASTGPTPVGPSPASNLNFFGMLVNHLVTSTGAAGETPWPARVGFGSLRLWDVGTMWGDLQPTDSANYNWAALDKLLTLAANNNVDVLYTFGGTPPWALAKNISIVSISRNNNVVTVTTSAPHGLTFVTIYSATAQSTVSLADVKDASFNGSFTITGTPTPTTVTFTQTGANASSTGGSFSAVCTGSWAPSACSEAPYNISDWDNFVTAIATRSNGRIKYYEMWNEANLQYFWKGSKEQLVTMAQHARKIIKGVDPQAVILSPSTTVSYSTQALCNTYDPRCGSIWMNLWLGLGGNQYIDAVAFHAYPTPANGPGAEQVVGQVNLQLAAMKNNGVGGLPLWDTESSWGENSSVANSSDQVAFVARHLLMEASIGVQRSYWYAWDNTGWGTDWWNSSVPGPNGLLGITPSGVAYTTVANLLKNATYSSPCTNLAADTTTYACSITLSDGRYAQAVWNTVTAKNFSVLSLPGGAGFSHYTTLDGVTHLITQNSVSISAQPIFLLP